MEILKIIGGILIILGFVAFVVTAAYVDLTTDTNDRILKPPMCYYNYILSQTGLCKKN